MKPVLLFFAGLVQMLVVLLHVIIAFKLASSGLAAQTAASLQVYNAAVLVTVLFFAYISMFRRHELSGPGLGRAACAFIAVFYLQRGLVEFIVHGVDPVNLGLALTVGGLYAAIALPEKRTVSTE